MNEPAKVFALPDLGEGLAEAELLSREAFRTRVLAAASCVAESPNQAPSVAACARESMPAYHDRKPPLTGCSMSPSTRWASSTA